MNRILNKVLSLGPCLLLGSVLFESPALAATFSGNAGGLSGSSSVINADGTGDYVNLSDAAHDFTHYAPGVESDYTFFLASDITETSIACFANATNGHSLSSHRARLEL